MINCSNEANNQCITCKEKEPDKKIEVNFLKNNVQFSRYENENDSPLLSFNTTFKTELFNLISANNITFNEYDISKVNNSNLAAIIIYTDSSNEEVMFSDIDRMIFYIKANNGFRTFLFKKLNNTLKIQPEYSFHTNYFSSNDIYDFQTISSPNKKSHSYLLINKNLINPNSKKPSDLQYFLKKRVNQITGFSKSGCRNPCDSEEGVCIVKGGGSDLEGNWSCSAWVGTIEEEIIDDEPICNEKRVNKTINDEVNFPASDILFISYNFKYYFLENSTKGREYINMYYQISQNMDAEAMNYDFAVYIYNTIKYDLLPICSELMNNSKSNEVLITENQYNNLLGKINYLDTKLNNSSSTKILNKVKTDLTNYKNKSVSYVYNSFQN